MERSGEVSWFSLETGPDLAGLASLPVHLEEVSETSALLSLSPNKARVSSANLLNYLALKA
jgi:hypothetical protein